MLKRWRGRNDAGLWEANVAYVVELALLDVVVDERRLRPREAGEESFR